MLIDQVPGDDKKSICRSMKRIFRITPFILLIVLTLGCQDCKEWYTSLELKGATKDESTNEQLEGWFETIDLNNELNFWVAYYYTADGFERCKSSSKIHTLEKDKMELVCTDIMIVGEDTVPAYTNIISYFDLALELKGNDFYTFDTINYELPRFTSRVNLFKMTVPLSDGDLLSGSVFLSVN